jgi:hypothetical protein
VDPCWDDVTDHLLALATLDLEDGLPPRPTLVAYEGERLVALVGMRPFGPGEVATALAELLGLLLPLGIDRVALGVPGRAWSLDDPIPPVIDDADLRRTVLTVLTADRRRGAPELDGWLFPYERDAEEGLVWHDGRHVGPPDGPATEVLRSLLHRFRASRRGERPTTESVLRFARCVLHGHAIQLAPELVEHLGEVRVAPVR